MAVIGAINVIFGAITDAFEKGVDKAASKLKNFEKVVDAIKGEGAGKSIKDIGEVINKVGTAMQAADKAFIEGKSGVESFYEGLKQLPVIGEFAQGLEKIGRVITGLDRDIAKMEFAAAFGTQLDKAKVALQKFGMDAAKDVRNQLADMRGENYVNAFFGDDREIAQAQVNLDKFIRDTRDKFKGLRDQNKENGRNALEALEASRKGKDNISDRAETSRQLAALRKKFDTEDAILAKQERQLIAAKEQSVAIAAEHDRRQKVLDLMEEQRQKQIEIAKATADAVAELEQTAKRAGQAVNDPFRPKELNQMEDFLKSHPEATINDYNRALVALRQTNAFEKQKEQADKFRDTVQGLLRDLAEAGDPGKGGRTFDLARSMFSDDQIKRVKELWGQIDELNRRLQNKAEIEAKNQELEGKAKSIREDAMTDIEKYGERVKEINDLQERGLISAKQAEAAKTKAGKEFASATGAGLAKLPGLVARQFTFSLPTSETVGKDPAAELKKIAEKELEKATIAADELKKIREAAEKGGIMVFNIGVA